MRIYGSIHNARSKVDIEGQRHLSKLRAERRAGEMLKENSEIHPGGDRRPLLHDEIMPIPKLSDLGITPLQSHRWQVEADVPEEKCALLELPARARGGQAGINACLNCHLPDCDGADVASSYKEREANSATRQKQGVKA